MQKRKHKCSRPECETCNGSDAGEFKTPRTIKIKYIPRMMEIRAVSYILSEARSELLREHQGPWKTNPNPTDVIEQCFRVIRRRLQLRSRAR